MGDATRQDTQRLQLVHPLKLVFEANTVGDVDTGGDQPSDPAVGIPQQRVMPCHDAFFATACDDWVFRKTGKEPSLKLATDQCLDPVTLAFWQSHVEPVLADDLIRRVAEEVAACLVEAHEPEVHVGDLYDDP
jgi:hypothetical protein